MFERVTPESQGIASQGIIDFVRTVNEKNLHIHSFRILRRDQVIAESFYAPYRPENRHMLFSLSKSFTSAAVGFAVQEGLLSLDDKLLSFYEGRFDGEPCENMKKITLRHLLTMNTGHETEPPVFQQSEGSDWEKTFLESYVRFEPGTHFLYNTAATYMLSAVVQKAAGMNILDYLRPRLFEPLGISADAWWEMSPQGICTGGFGLNVRLDDLMRFGTLCLHKGCYEGRQILPESWFEEASSFWSDNGPGMEQKDKGDWNMGYGYQFWLCKPEGVYRGDGAFGQYMIIMPKQEMIYVGNSGLNDMGSVMQAIWDHLLPAVRSDKALPEADEAVKEELHRLTDGRALTVNALEEKLNTAPFCAPCDGTYLLSQNPLGMETLQLKKGSAEALVSTANRTLTVPLCSEWKDCSWSSPASGKSSMEKLASRAFEADGKLYLTLACSEAPFVEELKLDFLPHGLTGEIRQNVGSSGEAMKLIGVLEDPAE